MPDLVTLDVGEIRARIAAACIGRPGVAAAYLFGSSLGACRPDSDIDVGIVPSPGHESGSVAGLHAALSLEADLAAMLGSFEGHAFDVTVLDAGRPLFAFRVLREGALCCENDREAHTDFLEAVARGHAENAPRHERALREVLSEPLHGG